MKPKNSAMITEDKVFRKLKETPEIFCIADDFCKVFDAQMAKYTFKTERKRKYHRASRMSKAEIMVIMILFHSSGYRCLKHFYLEKVCKHMRHLFPEVVSYNRFVELEREIAIPLIVFSSRKFYLANVQVSALWTAINPITKGKKFGNLQIGVTKKAYKQKKRRNLPQNCGI